MIEEHGFFGNIWVRQNHMLRAGDTVGGHIHFFDHVSLLVQGSVSVTIDGKNTYVFNAPTFIVIRKNESHTITALKDNTVWYCVFAARDIYGDVQDIVDPKNDPWFTYKAPSDFWQTHPLSFPVTQTDAMKTFEDDTSPDI